jgi:hypothetical protein
MSHDYEVSLTQDIKLVGAQGNLIHHPLNGPFRNHTGADSTIGIGYRLTFEGQPLTDFSAFDDVNVFYLSFHSDTDIEDHREAWADSLRAEVLKRLCPSGYSWYISCVGNVLGDGSVLPAVVEDMRETLFDSEVPDHVVVQSKTPSGFREVFMPRLFVEVPHPLLTKFILRYWPQAWEGAPIEGYNMPSGHIHLLEEWNKKAKDWNLLRRVIDQVFVAFYTFPEEHKHFAFVSNKLNFTDIQNLVNVRGLRELCT